jgi:hypothetical protein
MRWPIGPRDRSTRDNSILDAHAWALLQAIGKKLIVVLGKAFSTLILKTAISRTSKEASKRVCPIVAHRPPAISLPFGHSTE